MKRMTVEQLIEELQKIEDKKKEVCVTADGGYSRVIEIEEFDGVVYLGGD